jgi:ankyrin repeat protein
MSNWERYKQTMRTAPDMWSAAKTNDIPALMRLIRNSDVNAKDARGYSPLMLAAYSGSIEAAKLLLQVGADPDTAEFAGNSALMGAAFKGNVYMVDLLLAKGANPAARNKAGMTALDFAVMFGRTAVQEKLLAQQAGLKIRGRVVILLKIIKNCFSPRTSI